MAYYNSNSGAPADNSSLGMNKKKEDEAAPASAPVALTTASANGANSGPTAAPLSGNPIAQNSAPKAASSGMAGGFQSYQKANQGTATNRLADAANRNVAAQGQAAQKGIAQATDQFGKKVDAGSLANRYQAVQDVSNTVNSARTLSAAPAAPVVAPQAPAPTVTTKDKGTGQTTITPVSPPPAAATPVAPPVQADYIPQVAGADRFKEVINAKYQGPESLRQAGLYQLASGKVNTAQTTLDQTKTAAGREDMLKDMYAKRGDYTRGLNKLDSAVLNSSQSAVGGLQNTAAAQGNLQGSLDKAQIASGNVAQNRGQEIQDIRNQARDTFKTQKDLEVKKTDDRLSETVANWEQLPEHFRNILREQSKGNVGLGSAEAAYLGIQNGEGLYNAGADVIKSNEAVKEKLITRDEQARQAALSQLAGLDNSNMLDTGLKYDDASQAGTQTYLDAIDLKGTREGLNQVEQGFQDYANNADLTGYGVKKNKSNGKKYYADETANLGELFRKSGYDFDKRAATNSIGNADVLKNLAGVSRGAADPNTAYGADGAKEGMGQGFEMGGSTPGRDALDAYGSITGINALTGALGLGTLTDATGKAYNGIMDGGPIPGLNEGLDKLGLGGIAPSNRSIIDTLSFGQGSKLLDGAFNSAFGAGANTKQSKSKASALAQKDLQNKITGAVDKAGFNNRFQIQDNEKTNTRTAALTELLKKLNNTGNA